MEKDTLKNKYADLTFLIHQEFERNTEMYGDKIKCRKGCSQCCSQIFRITEFDASIINDHMKILSHAERQTLKSKAEKYLLKLSSDEPVSEEYNLSMRLPCPALNDEGACLIYEARPVICRRFGPPVYDYKNPGKLYACELNFGNGEEISDNELIPRQTNIGKLWDEIKTEFNKENNLNERASTTIAEALLDS